MHSRFQFLIRYELCILIPILCVVFSFSWCPLKHKNFYFDQVQFISFCFVTCAVGVLLRKPFLVEPRDSLLFSSKTFYMFDIKIQNFCTVTSYSEVMMRLEVISVEGVRCECSLTVCTWVSGCSSIFC